MGTQSSSLQTLWMYNGIDCMCACQNWYIHGHETWLKVLDTPSLLRPLAHETMYTQACCAGCVTAHTLMHCIRTLCAHLPLIGRKSKVIKIDRRQIRQFVQNGDDTRLGHVTSCTDRQEVINTSALVQESLVISCVWWILMLIEPITYATQMAALNYKRS